MGNLARPGFPATTSGLWPYTYDSCDVGTFPNQTSYPNMSAPASAVYSTASKFKYNFNLSWLPGQCLSACSCPNSDHPGPTGRGAPETDIFEILASRRFPDLPSRSERRRSRYGYERSWSRTTTCTRRTHVNRAQPGHIAELADDRSNDDDLSGGAEVRLCEGVSKKGEYENRM